MPKIIVGLFIIISLLGCSEENNLSNITFEKLKIGIKEFHNINIENLSLWPEIIEKKGHNYRLRFHNVGVQDARYAVSFNELDKKKRYVSFYELIVKKNYNYQKDDYNYGPGFGWNPDGTISSKSIVDSEKNNIVLTYYYNKSVESQEIYDADADIDIRNYYDSNGQILGNLMIKYQRTWYRKTNESYIWEGKDLSECDFYTKVSEFKKMNKKSKLR